MENRIKSENLYWVWMTEQLGAGNKHIMRLVDSFGSAYEVYNATEEELVRSETLTDDMAHRLADKSLERAHQIIDYCAMNSIGILAYPDPNYPNRLKTMQDPPGVLYYKGTVPRFDEKLCIGVVGTRKMSDYGKRAAYKIAYELASAGAIIVSGMALGIDSVAATGALVADGMTVAVLGCGIDVVYPTQHGKLKRTIENRGLVITEFSPGTRPLGTNFPIRNRIISGLCQGTLVVEADDKSGAMITAKHALGQGRGIFAVPGNIDESNSMGTNSLIKTGALSVTSADDILSVYEMLYGKYLNYSALTFAKSIFDYEKSEDAFDKLEISARPYGNVVEKKEKSTSILRPTRKPPKAPEEELVSTNPKINEKKKPHIEFPKRLDEMSEEMLNELTEYEKKIIAVMPLDRAISIDQLASLGFIVNEAMAAMTMLEIKGFVSTLPGNLYIRR